MSIEELRQKYAGAYDSDFEAQLEQTETETETETESDDESEEETAGLFSGCSLSTTLLKFFCNRDSIT